MGVIVIYRQASLPPTHHGVPPPPPRALWIVAGLLEGARQIMMEFYKLV